MGKTNQKGGATPLVTEEEEQFHTQVLFSPRINLRLSRRKLGVCLFTLGNRSKVAPSRGIGQKDIKKRKVKIPHRRTGGKKKV